MSAELLAWFHDLVEYAGSPGFRADLHARLDELAKAGQKPGNIPMGDSEHAGVAARDRASFGRLFTPVT